jgi:hypothetical protein
MVTSSGRLLLSGALLVCSSATVLAQTVPNSAGFYRIPYANGTDVRVTRDHADHTPVGRIDMGGRGGSEPYRIVAAAGGTIRAIVDSFSARQDSGNGVTCNNNYVWIEHANGEWTKYSHMRQNSTRQKAGLNVGDRVDAGDYLGDEGQVGCASGPHLHFEVGRPRATDPFTVSGGFLTDNANSARNRVPRICGIPGRRFDSGEDYTARSVPGALSGGSAEVARHGQPIADYQCQFDQARLAGYAPVWIDVFNSGGKAYVNSVWRSSGEDIRAVHGLTGAQYQDAFEAAKKAGYRPSIVESYQDGGVRYLAVFRKSAGPEYRAYHGRDAAFHQSAMDNWPKEGFVPVSVSVVSDGGRRYTGLFEKRNVGSWQARSQLTPAEYQGFFDSNAKAGRRIAYLNGYRHDGQAYIVAIATSQTPAGGVQRHGMAGTQYQDAWEVARKAGLLTRAVAGYDSGDGARYAASWRK